MSSITQFQLTSGVYSCNSLSYCLISNCDAHMLHICNIQLHLPKKSPLHIGLTDKWSYITPINILKNGVTVFFTPFLKWNYGSPATYNSFSFVPTFHVFPWPSQKRLQVQRRQSPSGSVFSKFEQPVRSSKRRQKGEMLHLRIGLCFFSKRCCHVFREKTSTVSWKSRINLRNISQEICILDRFFRCCPTNYSCSQIIDAPTFIPIGSKRHVYIYLHERFIFMVNNGKRVSRYSMY